MNIAALLLLELFVLLCQTAVVTNPKQPRDSRKAHSTEEPSYKELV